MEVILFSNHCPKCNVLTQKLKQADIDYSEVNDEELMISKGFMQVPMLEVNGVIMDFTKAIKWVNERTK
jgi:glutaredoxin-related protein